MTSRVSSQASKSALTTFFIPIDKASFDNLNKWLEFVREDRGNNILIVLLGNKSDLEEARVVSTADADAKAKETGVLFREVSAKDGTNVSEIFKAMIKELISNEVAVSGGPTPSNQASN